MNERTILEKLAAYVPSFRDILEDRRARREEGLRDAIERHVLPPDTRFP